MDKIKEILKLEFNIKDWQVTNVIELIDASNTIPFIARYRKEQTGSMSDVELRDFDERLKYLKKLSEEKEKVIRTIEEQGKLTEELSKQIDNAVTLTELEDLYRPYKPKKKTRASIAKEKGLEPLAEYLYSQVSLVIDDKAREFLNDKVETGEEAIQGACDIISENISDNADYRKEIRRISYSKGVIKTKKNKEDEKQVYQMYYDFNEKINRIPGHRILAINRGENEEALKVAFEVPEQEILDYIESRVIKQKNDEFKTSQTYSLLIETIKDSYKRLISPSIEREIRADVTERAEINAIKVFGNNIKNLLLQKPIKESVVMGFDPAYRTGCKIAVIDGTGKLLDTNTVYPVEPKNDVVGSEKELTALIEKYGIDIIAIGNGTASRESEQFVANMIKKIKRKVYYTIVSEAGASVYSASKLANEEYPDINVSLRGAISIARRLQDPMAELVKIDPKSIGVGQYQHDVNQKKLDEALTGVVEDTVNSVGVNVNTATASLLQYVSGVSKSVAENIVKYRDENGKFKNRKTLNKVAKLGPAAYTQCAGFLRISDGSNILDNTAVHPESYDVAEKLLNMFSINLKEYKEKYQEFVAKTSDINTIDLSKKLEVGEPTIKDIINELAKPGRDPRDDMPEVIVKSDVLKFEDLEVGMQLNGTVRNVTDFGAFVDIGIKGDGLVHISELSDQYVKNPMEVVQVGDVVSVRVIGIDKERQRVSLSMKNIKI